MKKEDNNHKEGKKPVGEDSKDFELEDTEVKTKSYINSSLSMVKQKVMIVVILLAAVGVIYFIFNDGSSNNKVVEQKKEFLSKEKLEDLSAKSTPVSKNVTSEELQIPQKLPELPKLSDPVLPPPIVNQPPTVLKPVGPTFQPTPVAPVDVPKKAFTNKINLGTPMLVISGGAEGSSNAGKSNASHDISSLTAQDLLDPKKFEEFKKSMQSINSQQLADENATISRVSGQIMANYRGNLDYIISQGKTLDVVLENGINTELQGTLRGLVSRDTYSDSGNVILIPKGSRLIGSYSTSISASQSRVEVQWSVIKMPNGIDINVNSIGTDRLGRSGVYGDVDARFNNVILSSLLISGIQLGAGQLTKSLLGSNAITTTTNPASATNPTASTTTTGDAAAIATSQAFDNLSRSLTEFVKKYTNVSPVIRVKQGERVKVFVQQDLVFPKSAFNPINIQ